jgi:hypothetical protein
MIEFNEEKAINVILYLGSKRKLLDLYATLKMLFYADKSHFQKWGRTITGDTYHRLPHGPAPTNLYDILKSIRGDGSWQTDYRNIITFSNSRTFTVLKEPNIDLLSQSDIDELDASFNAHIDKDFQKLKTEAHLDKAFANSNSSEITLRDMAEGDDSLLKYIEECEKDEEFLQNCRFFRPIDQEKVC